MRIVVLGAHGRTGRVLVERILDAGHTAVAITRRPAEFPMDDFPKAGVLQVGEADARDETALTAALTGAAPDAVVSTLGVPMTLRHIDTYSVTARNVVAAMRAADVRRLVVVSSTAVTHYPGRTDAPVALRIVEPVLKSTLGRTTYADQRRMEDVVAASGLDWTIVRPSGLFDLPHITDYVAGEVDPVGAFTSRRDLAHYLLTLAHRQGPQARVTVSTVTDTPTLWDMVRREALAG